jgi:stage V sporulation protein B
MENKKNNRGNGFLIQGSILAMASIISRMIGIIYRVPLTRIIGNTGNGYYATAFEVYSILLLLSSYSLPLAVSKLVAARTAKGEHKNAYRLFQCALVLAILVGIIASLISYFGATFFAKDVLSSAMSSFALRILSPALLFVAVMGVIRGYFQGLGTMIPTSVSQIIEQIVNGIVSVAGAFYLYQYGKTVGEILKNDQYAPAYGAAGGTLGTVAGAVAGFLVLLIIFLMYRRVLKRRIRRDKTRRQESYSFILKILLLTIIPVILSAAVYNISTIIDLGIWGKIMAAKGLEEEARQDLWGIFTGKYKLLTNVPISVATALSASSIPSITAAIVDRDYRLVNYKINSSIRLMMIIAIPSAVGLAVLASPILQLLFHETSAREAHLLQVGSIAVVFYALSTMTNGILQATNKMRLPVVHAVIALGLHLGILYIMLQFLDLNIYGVVYSYIIFAMIMCILNAISIKKYLRYKQEIKKTFIIPCIASAVMGGITYGVYFLMQLIIKRNTISTIIALAAAVVVYFVMLLLLKGIREEELNRIPKGRVLVRIAKKMHLL